MTQMDVEILTPGRPLFSGKVGGVMVPGSVGYMTILPGHTPFISELGTGEMVVQVEGGSSNYFLSGGYIEVQGSVLKVLADIIELPENIDQDRAEKARSRALDRLDGKLDPHLDITRAQDSLKRAESRILMAQAIGGLARQS